MNVKVSGLPLTLMGWNTSFIRKDLDNKEAYYCRPYYLFGIIPISEAYIVNTDQNNWRLWYKGNYLPGFYFIKSDGHSLLGNPKTFFVARLYL